MPQIVVEIFLLDSSGAFVSDLETFIAGIDVSDVALWGELDPLLAGKLQESPEEDTVARRASVIEAVGAALLLHIVNAEVSLSTQGLNGLLEDFASLVGVLLI